MLNSIWNTIRLFCSLNCPIFRFFLSLLQILCNILPNIINNRINNKQSSKKTFYGSNPQRKPQCFLAISNLSPSFDIFYILYTENRVIQLSQSCKKIRKIISMKKQVSLEWSSPDRNGAISFVWI